MSMVYNFLANQYFTAVSYTLVIVALFLEDIRRAVMGWEADYSVQVVSLLLFVFFFVELILQFYVGMDFFYIFLDAIATASLVFDFAPLLPAAEDSSALGTSGTGSNLRTWRVARAGSKA